MKRKLLCLFVFVMVLFPNEKINALTGNVTISCDSNQLKINETTNCYIKCKNFNDEVSSFHAKLNVDSNITIVSMQKDNTWEGATDNNIIDLYTDKNKKNDVNIASFTIKLNNNNKSTIILSDIKIGDKSFEEISLPNSKIVINESSGQPSYEPETKNPDEEITNPQTGKSFGLVIGFIISTILMLVALISIKKGTKGNE